MSDEDSWGYQQGKQDAQNNDFNAFRAAIDPEYEAGARSQTCFPGDAKVATPSGEKRLDSLKAGDEVLSWAVSSNSLVAAKIYRVKRYRAGRIFKLGLDDGSFLRVTAHHTLLTNRGWQRVARLASGDSLQMSEGRYLRKCLSP